MKKLPLSGVAVPALIVNLSLTLPAVAASMIAVTL
jgi:hypothetical protein